VGTRLYEALPAVPVNEYVGLDGKGPIRVEAACATGSAAVFTAYNAVVSGYVDTAIAIGVEKMCEVDTPTSTAVGSRGWELSMGVPYVRNKLCRILCIICYSTYVKIWDNGGTAC
jgi:acetyl-CoA acetyltransferase